MGGISIWQLLIVFGIVILVFGTKKLRNMGGDVGSAIRNFKQAMGDGDSEKNKDDSEDDAKAKMALLTPSLSYDDLGNADLVLVMSDNQRRAVGELAPEALGKTLPLGKWLDNGQGRDIPDPYRKSREAFEHVHVLLQSAVGEWAKRL